MQEMNGVYLDRASIIYGDGGALQVGDQLTQGLVVGAVQNKSKTAFLLVFAKQYHGPHKVGVLEEGIRDQQ